MQLSIFDVSKYLGVTPKTIERWIVQGKLPFSGKGGNYQFHMSELAKWAATHGVVLNLHNAGKDRQRDEPLLPLSVAVENGGVHFNIPGSDMESVLRGCLETAPGIPGDFKTDLFERLLERENAISTGIGNGIAVPHPREPLAYLKAPMVSVCILDSPVDYGALDNLPVSVLCLILSPSLRGHLHLLSSLSFCLKDSQFTSFLKSGPGQNQLVQQIELLQADNLL